MSNPSNIVTGFKRTKLPLPSKAPMKPLNGGEKQKAGNPNILKNHSDVKQGPVATGL